MFNLFLSLLWLVAPVLAATYCRIANIVGDDFNKAFEYQNIEDPTHGRVNYVDKETAQRQNLTFASEDTFILRADATKNLTDSDPGRDSVRIRSFEQYERHVLIVDVRHMPEGCATWPAIWETKEDGWPGDGEVDILEGVNNASPNSATLHTGPNCTMPALRDQTGLTKATNCDAAVDYNVGCGVAMTESNNYGPAFNANGGGWYAMERTDEFISVWFWPRGCHDLPYDIRKGSDLINTDHWGTPSAYFPNDTCDIGSKFGPNNIIINLTFCGDWANTTYTENGCPGNCTQFVDSNPEAFENAYFDIGSLMIYT